VAWCGMDVQQRGTTMHENDVEELLGRIQLLLNEGSNLPKTAIVNACATLSEKLDEATPSTLSAENVAHVLASEHTCLRASMATACMRILNDNNVEVPQAWRDSVQQLLDAADIDTEELKDNTQDLAGSSC